MSWSTLNLRIGEPENTNRSNAGDLFTADRLAPSEVFPNIKPDRPVEMRVLSVPLFALRAWRSFGVHIVIPDTLFHARKFHGFTRSIAERGRMLDVKNI